MPPLVCFLVQLLQLFWSALRLYLLRATAQVMPPRAPGRTTRRSAPPYVDPTVLGALSIADLRSLCIQHGLPSTETGKTLNRRLRGSTTPSLGQNVTGPAAQPGPNIVNNDTAAPRPDFNEGQMQTIRQLIKDTVQESSREIANEAAKAAVNAFQVQVSSNDTLPAQRPLSIVPGAESATRAAVVSFASPFKDIPDIPFKDILDIPVYQGDTKW